jgi:DNA mismatch endonuclease (patch repair protein)
MKRTKAQISYNMSRIKSKNTLIEKRMKTALRRNKLLFKSHPKVIPGNPDFVITESKIAIFCDSSFWHGYKNMETDRHNFKRNKKFWINKILCNIKRDKKVNRILRNDGWRVLRFWDFQIKGNIDKCVNRIKLAVQK